MVVTMATPNFIMGLTLTMSSIREYAPCECMRVYGVGWSEELVNRCREFINQNGYNVEIRSWPLDYKARAEIVSAGRSGEVLRLKSRFIYECLRDYDQPVAWIDADVILEMSITPLFNMLKDDKYWGAYYRPKAWQRGRVNASLMIWSNRPKGLEMCRRHMEISKTIPGIMHTGGYEWWQDQLANWELLQEYPGTLVAINHWWRGFRKGRVGNVVSRPRLRLMAEKMNCELVSAGHYLKAQREVTQ